MIGRLMLSEVTWANGESLSSELDLTSWSLVALQIPSAFTGTSLSFKARPGFSDDTKRYPGEALQDVYDDAGNEVVITVNTSRYVVFTSTKLDAVTGIGKVRIRSGTTGSPSNQAAARVALAVLAPID